MADEEKGSGAYDIKKEVGPEGTKYPSEQAEYEKNSPAYKKWLREFTGKEGSMEKKAEAEKFGGLTRVGNLVAVDGALIDESLLKDADFKEEGAELFELPEVSGPKDKKEDLPTAIPTEK